MPHIKEEKKAPEKEMNEMPTRNLPDAEFQTLVRRVLSALRENFNKETVNLKTVRESQTKNQSEIKNTRTAD